MNDNDWPQSIRPYRVSPPVNSVGIVMPVRDGLKFFKLAFHSILNFTDYHYMMSIVDNLSSPETKKVLRSIGTNHKTNLFDYAEVNRSASINLAIRQMFTCDGINFGCVVSQDSIVEPQWLSRLMQNMLGDNQIGIVLPDTHSGGCILFRKQAYMAVNGFDESLHGGYEDMDFCNRVKQKGYLIAMDDRVYVHRFFVEPFHNFSSEYERTESERRYFERYPQKIELKLEEKSNGRFSGA